MPQEQETNPLAQLQRDCPLLPFASTVNASYELDPFFHDIPATFVITSSATISYLPEMINKSSSNYSQ